MTKSKVILFNLLVTAVLAIPACAPATPAPSGDTNGTGTQRSTPTTTDPYQGMMTDTNTTTDPYQSMMTDTQMMTGTETTTP